MDITSSDLSQSSSPRDPEYTSFIGNRRAASGKLAEVVRATKVLLESSPNEELLIFDNDTSLPFEMDFRGTLDDVLERLHIIQASLPAKRGPGRPKLGVIGREVTLLPRHWEWLDAQPGGASVILRRLVEAARKANPARDRVRQAQESVYRFLTAMAGDLPGYEEALRALYANDGERFKSLIRAWPEGIRDHAEQISQPAFALEAT